MSTAARIIGAIVAAPVFAWCEPLLFDAHEVLPIELRGPVSVLVKTKHEREDHAFVLAANGFKHQVLVRARGKSRMRVCDFPPLRVMFSQEHVAASVFAGQRSLKLVSHCSARRAAQIDLLQEYAAYRIFNLISEYGFKVRLLRVRYVDVHDAASLDRFAFAIESPGAMADRVGGEFVKLPGISRTSLDQPQLAAVAVFQYLIGNTDWSYTTSEGEPACCHNADLLRRNLGIYYVPYDFDLAGLVNARYAYPDPRLRIRKVTQRKYLGLCMSRATLAEALARIVEKRTEIVDLVHALPELTEREQAATVAFLDGFFQQAEDREKMLDFLERSCR